MTDVRTLLINLLGYEGSSSGQIKILGRVLLDLLMEVEALRSAVIELSARSAPADEGASALDTARHGLPGPRTVYADAYAETAWQTHNSAGPSSGWEKLLQNFYGSGRSDPDWRECIMLRRLGFTESAIASYRAHASQAETFS